MDGTVFLMLVIVGIIALIILILALTNRIIFKMAARNFIRRKAQSAIVIAGLMIGTAIISSALVVQDTMTYVFEEDVYLRLGEVDEEIWGLNSFGTVTYYNESIYESVAKDLANVSEIEAVAPVISDMGSVLDWDTLLGEPSATILGLDSQVLRNTVFGDLDGSGFYPDKLGAGEVAINSRLADEIEASKGDTIQLSYGTKNPSNPFIPDRRSTNFTIAKIIDEIDLYGKANHYNAKTVFFELDTLQQLLNRHGEINAIWISNKGDYAGGEQYSEEVNDDIQNALDNAVGISDAGLSLDTFSDSIVLSATGFAPFPLHNAQRLFELGEKTNTTIMYGLMVPTITLNNIPTNNRSIMGVKSTDPNFPVMDESDIHFLSGPFEEFKISNGTPVMTNTITLTGMVQPNNLIGYPLGMEHELFMPIQLRAITLGVMDFNASQLLVHQGAYVEEMATFMMVSGLDNFTIGQTLLSLENQMNEDFKGEDLNLEVRSVKADNLKTGRESGEGIGTLFLIFGMFSIIAGIVLIINIFVMLGEERKSEMGMARAVGMKSKHLVRMYVFEGSLYAFVAALVGTFLGLFFGWVIIQAFEYIFGSTETTGGGGGFNIPFHFTWSSIFIGFAAGLVITFLTIIAISYRITKLNIIRAIRRIPEPRTVKKKTRTNIIGAVLVVAGIIFCYYGMTTNEGAGWMIGINILFIGAAMVAYRWVSFRAAITTAGFLIIFFMIPPLDIPIMSDADYSGAESFVLSGVFLVLAGIFIVMYNSEVLLKLLQKTVGREKSTRAVLKTAISYPMDSKFKTAMTLGMFALIIFTVTVIAMIASMQASQGDALLDEQTGGYDVMGFTNPRTPFENLTTENLPPELRTKTDNLETISSALVTVVDYDSKKGEVSDYDPTGAISKVEQYELLGVSDSFLKTTGFSLNDRDKKYKSDREAWEALDENSSLCIIDGSRLENPMMFGPPPTEPGGIYVGGDITITDFMGQNRTRTFKVIGIMDQQIFIRGVFIKKAVVINEYGGGDDIVVIKLKSGENADTYAKNLERTYLELGLQTFDVKGIINDVLQVSNSMMYLMEGFLGIGLLVGIAGIGIISYRNVIERRQQIGMLRAIGFKKSMITKSFLIETSFITILAILIGILLGIGIGWTIYTDSFQALGASFDIPWLNLLTIAVIAYISTVLFTIYPSYKASKIPPAEALRYIE